jgi:energy-coupling factor transporter ATP-binding protein EcfA2
MITELRVRNFKKLKKETFTFKSGITLLAGDNNSGKSTIIQAIALWQFCSQEIARHAGSEALRRGVASQRIDLALEDLTPLPLPALRYLWTNQRTNTKIEVGCAWDLTANARRTRRRLAFSIGLTALGINAGVKYSNVGVGEPIPKAAFLPAFAGIKAKETPLTEVERERLIGEGLAGAVLRNVLADLCASHDSGIEGLSGKAKADFLKTSPWWRLGDILHQVFGLGLVVRNGAEGPLVVDVQDVTLGYKGRLKRAPRSRPRDIMLEGSGFLQWLSVYTLAVPTDLNVLLLDEPDAHLHKQLQDELVFRVRNLVGNRAQVILATHSTELLGEAECTSVYWLEKGRHGYLQDDDHRRKLFLGLGGLYAPKIQNLKKHKKLLMVEGPSDLEVLRILSVKLMGSWPDDIVVWFYRESDVDKSKYGRRTLFRELRSEIAGLKGLSLEDRDDKRHFRDVPADLGHAGRAKDGLALRMWRRRNLENYLLSPAAIARATGKPESKIRQFLIDRHGFAPVGSFTAFDCHPSMALVDGKQILSAHPDSVANVYGTTVYQIAEAMDGAEIPEDVQRIIREVHAVWDEL